MAKNNSQIHKQTFIKLLAKESGFTIADTKYFWEAFIRLLKRDLAAEKTINISGFGKMSVTTIAPRRLWLGLKNEYGEVGESKRIVFHISPVLRRALEGKDEE